jgi:hypothetical protein
MNTDRPRPTDPDDDDAGMAEPYRLSDEPPPPRPTHPVEPDAELLPPADGARDRPRRRRRRRRREEEADEGEMDQDVALPDRPREIGERILSRPEEPAPPNWWVLPAVLTGVGGVLCLIPLVVLAVQSGAAFGAVLAVLTVCAIVVQVALVSGFLMAVGSFFGIDYGPAHHALVKLAAIVTVVDGLTGTIALGCLPCGVVIAGLVGAGLFQYLFRLAIYEMLLTLSGIMVASWALNAVIIKAMMK